MSEACKNDKVRPNSSDHFISSKIQIDTIVKYGVSKQLKTLMFFEKKTMICIQSLWPFSFQVQLYCKCNLQYKKCDVAAKLPGQKIILKVAFPYFFLEYMNNAS